MNWPELKRQLRLQPYRIDPYRSISHREARRIWKAQGRPDVLELLEGARIKSGKTPAEWEALTGLKPKRNRVSHSAIIRRWAVACVFVLLMSAFLAFTVPGRAFAAKVYNTFTTIVENILNIRVTEEPDNSNIEPNASTLENQNLKFSSLDEAKNEVERPLLYLADPNYVLEDIDISTSQFMGLIVLSTYLSSNDTIIIIEQRWPIDGQKAELNLLMPSGEHYSFDSSSGLSFEGVYIEADHSYFGGAIHNSMLITVNAVPIDNPQTAEYIIENMQFYN